MQKILCAAITAMAIVSWAAEEKDSRDIYSTNGWTLTWKDDSDYWNWPCCGEIDIVEIWGSRPCNVAACLHTSDKGWKKKANEHHRVTGSGSRIFKGPGESFHTYTLDWYEDRIVFFYDGKVVRDADGNMIKEPTDKFPMEMKADYVRYYEQEK